MPNYNGLYSTLSEKRDEYRKYINDHVNDVQQALFNNRQLFITEFDLDHTSYLLLKDEISKHDSSKFSVEEFEPYRKKFFPIDEREKEESEEGFQMAWKHHYENNPHHWKYWLDEDGNPKEMDDLNIIHMICDWIGMGYKFGNTAREYYMKNKHEITLADSTKEKVEYILNKMGN